MLDLILDRAGTGKTQFIMNDFRNRMEAGETGMLLIVPEQYSHDAERRLCSVCGERLSMHGETLSFTRLCGRVFAELGAPARMLDGGGQMLVMHRALESAAPGLKVFGTRGSRVELLRKMTDAIKELKSLNISAGALEGIASAASYPLSDKLRDLSQIYGAYNALLQVHGGDASDALALLSEMIGVSTVGHGGHIYFDGFNDFTALELRVIEELLLKKAEITVCLTCDQLDDSEVFELPRMTARKLSRLAEGCGAGVRISAADFYKTASPLFTPHTGAKSPELSFMEKHLFSAVEAKYPGQNTAISAYQAPTRYAECEYAAQKVRELVRAGCRWRDIGVMARDWNEYGNLCEIVFEKSGVPFFSSGRAELLSKPPAALIDGALDIAVSGWEYRQVFRYLKTGLLDIPADELAELENYVLKWNIRGSTWAREWTLPPSGYGAKREDSLSGYGARQEDSSSGYSARQEDSSSAQCQADQANEPSVYSGPPNPGPPNPAPPRSALERINNLRRRITAPLARLREGMKGVTEASVKLGALYGFMEEIKLAESLASRAEELEKRGEPRLADEYAQLWDVIISAMDQIFGILGDTKLSPVEFKKVFTLVLSGYDVGVIPVSLDRVALGGMAMSRRRDLKCLILLGVTDENFPLLTTGSGPLTDADRREMGKLGAVMPSGLEERLYREMNMLYSTLTLPSEQLALTYPGGGGARPAFLIRQLEKMFGSTVYDKGAQVLSHICDSAPATLLQHATPERALSEHLQPQRPLPQRALSEHLQPQRPLPQRAPSEHPQPQRPACLPDRPKLSPQTARRLYGQITSLSPTRVDRYYSCPFKHFAHNGLRLAPRVAAEFDAPAAGIFMHFVLEGVTREIKETVGFKNADEALCRELTGRFIEQYVHETLYDFEGRNARFVYLFRRMEEDVMRIVLDMLDELKKSDFEPLDFELDMAALGAAGVIDRIDGWEHDGKLYIRVIDYKTGRKSFSLSDVMHGRDMQMLIYLFAANEQGAERYGRSIAPAGVLYVPARDAVLNAARGTDEQKLIKQREDELKRGGLVLNDPLVIEAMENGDDKRYLPVKRSKDGFLTGDSLIDPEQFGLLSGHIGRMLSEASAGILEGDIGCSPQYKNANDNACLFCEFHTVCAFDDENGGKRRFIRKMKADEIWETLRGSGC